MKGQSYNTIENLFEGVLKPLHSKNARRIYEIFYQKRQFSHLTTHDIENVLEVNGLSISKKEINSWLVSLQEAGLISKNEERGKPVASKYEDRYTFDLWKLTETGLIIGERLPRLMTKQTLSLPSFADLTPSMIHELEDLYFTAKLLILLYDSGGQLNYRTIRNELAINREKLAVYSWPDAAYSDKPLFEITFKPPSLKSKIFKLLGWVIEQDLSFKLSEEGKKIAETIISMENASDS